MQHTSGADFAALTIEHADGDPIFADLEGQFGLRSCPGCEASRRNGQLPRPVRSGPIENFDNRRSLNPDLHRDRPSSVQHALQPLHRGLNPVRTLSWGSVATGAWARLLEPLLDDIEHSPLRPDHPIRADQVESVPASG